MQPIQRNDKRKQEHISARLRPETKAGLIKICEVNGLTLSDAVEQIISNYINYHKELEDRLSKIK